MIIILNICASVRKTCTGVHTWTGRDEEGGILRCILNESKSDSAARAHVSYISITEMRDSRSAPTRCISFVIIIFFFFFNKTLISFYFTDVFFLYEIYYIIFILIIYTFYDITFIIHTSILHTFLYSTKIIFLFQFYFKRKSRKWFLLFLRVLPKIIQEIVREIIKILYRTFFIISYIYSYNIILLILPLILVFTHEI